MGEDDTNSSFNEGDHTVPVLMGENTQHQFEWGGVSIPVLFLYISRVMFL